MLNTSHHCYDWTALYFPNVFQFHRHVFTLLVSHRSRFRTIMTCLYPYSQYYRIRVSSTSLGLCPLYVYKAAWVTPLEPKPDLNSNPSSSLTPPLFQSKPFVLAVEASSPSELYSVAVFVPGPRPSQLSSGPYPSPHSISTFNLLEGPLGLSRGLDLVLSIPDSLP